MTDFRKPTPPIFLHGMWRSGSTFVWSCFRRSDDTYCYFEPLIEGLAKLTPERINRATDGVIARNRHPKLDQPYLKEFEPLIQRRGVRQYKRAFATRKFILEPAARHQDLHNFISSLNDYAEKQNATAVLGFNRTVLRTGWFAQNFNGLNIHIDRDPVELWASYMEHRNKDDNTFLTRWMMVADLNRDEPFFKELINRLSIPTLPMAKIGKRKQRYRRMLDALSPQNIYDLVFTMWLATLLQALTHCDIILDVNLADTPGYGSELAKKVETETGIKIDFSDLRAPGKAADLQLEDQRSIENAAIRAFPLQAYSKWFDRDMCLSRLNDVTDRKSELLRQLLS